MPLLDEDAKDALRGYMQGLDQTDEGNGFPDLAVRVQYTAGDRSPYNRKVPQFNATGQALRCRIRPLTLREMAQMGANQLNAATNVAHFPRGTNLSGLDHLQHTARWGTPLVSTVLYDVVGTPSINALEITVQLKLTTNVRE